MKGIISLLTIVAVTASLAQPAAAKSSAKSPAAVTPLDTFTFDIAGFNSTSGVGYILGADQTATFGMTTTYPAAGFNGQDITITSSETTGATTTTDSFTVSTPTNFLTTTTVSGTKITALQLDIGDANSGVTSGTPNTVDYALPVTGNTQTGYILYTSSNTQFTLTPTVTLTNGGQSLAAVEGVNDGTTAISTLAVHNFTFSVTYNTIPVPEPSTWALSGLGLAAGAVAVRRRRLA